MLSDLGAVLIVFAVTHLVLVAALAWRPRAGPVPALLATGCGAVGGCELDARLAPGHVGDAVAAAVAAVMVAGAYAQMSRWLHPVGAAVWSSWLLLGAAVAGWGSLFLANLRVSPE